jgi:hypothetical protein
MQALAWQTCAPKSAGLAERRAARTPAEVGDTVPDKVVPIVQREDERDVLHPVAEELSGDPGR